MNATTTRCPGCGGYARTVGRDVLTGEDVLACDSYRDCGYRSDAAPDDRALLDADERAAAVVLGLFAEGAA